MYKLLLLLLLLVVVVVVVVVMDWVEYNSGSNRASDFKSTERVARGRFEITSTITPELYDTKSRYQLIVTKCEKLTNEIFKCTSLKLNFLKLSKNVLIQYTNSVLNFHWLFNCPIWPVRLQAASNRTGQIGQFGAAPGRLKNNQGLLRTNQIRTFCYCHNYYYYYYCY